MSGFKPWLYLPPKVSHDLSPHILKLVTAFKPWPVKSSNPMKLWGIEFNSPFGTAGGLDKKADSLNSWTKMGAGFLEIGTFTPRPQKPNRGIILMKDIGSNALWNSMGFPNAGYKAVFPKIKEFKRMSASKGYRPPLFINIGKNRDTKLEDSHKDYLEGLNCFADLADAFVINISSPNTKGLRDLHEEKNFKNFISPLIKRAKDLKTPLILKLSPDLEESYFKDFVKVCSELEIAGLTLTNTTSSRTEITKKLPEHGGVSGGPLRDLSLTRLKQAKEVIDEIDSSMKLISVGGVMTPEEAVLRLKSGANLVQFYSGLIYYGPHLLKDAGDFFSKTTDLQL